MGEGGRAQLSRVYSRVGGGGVSVRGGLTQPGPAGGEVGWTLIRKFCPPSCPGFSWPKQAGAWQHAAAQVGTSPEMT